MPATSSQPPNGQTAADTPPQQQLQVHVPPDLEYCYRDMFSVFGGAEEVVLEFGNRHRSMAGHASVSNRIVLSLSNAARLQQALTRMLQGMQERARHMRRQTGDSEDNGKSKA